MIQDTSFALDLLAGDGGAIAFVDETEATRRPEKVSAVTVRELYEGLVRAGRPEEERQRVLDVLDSKTVVPADHAVVWRAGQISGQLYDDGRPIESEDCVIAATALQEGEPIVTRNARFERVDGLEVETY